MIEAIFAPLYKRTNTGAIQQWQVEVDYTKGAYRSISGQHCGKLVTSAWTLCKGKNIGKTNETTPNEQARREAQAKFTKKCEHHYHHDIANIDTKSFIEPMLAKKYEDEFDGDYSDLYSQPKLDGMRCITDENRMASREGKPIISAPHIFTALQPIFKRFPRLIFDGELYCDKLKDDFNEIISLAKQSKPTKAKLAASAASLEYWVYDHIMDAPFADRMYDIVSLLNDIPGIVMVPTITVPDKETMDEAYAVYLASGMEGQMLRHGQSTYEQKRSKHLLKRKDFDDAEFIITAMHEGKGNYSGMVKGVSLLMPNGTECKAGIRGNQHYLTQLFAIKDTYVGSEATVRYQGYTPDGQLRFGIVHHLWNGKRDV